MSARRIKMVVIVCGLAFSAAVLIAWTQEWFRVTLTESAEHTIAVGGDSAAPAVLALSLSGVALVAALSLAGPFFRRVLGVLETLIGVSIVLAAGPGARRPDRGIRGTHHGVDRRVGRRVDSGPGHRRGTTPWPWVALVFGVLLALPRRRLAGPRAALAGLLHAGSKSAPDEPDGAAPTAASDWDSLTGEGTPPHARIGHARTRRHPGVT